DASCGKSFYSDRRSADGHRIAMEIWNRATGRAREGYRLAVVRCRRCGGFHIGQRPIDRRPRPAEPPRFPGVECATCTHHEPTMPIDGIDPFADW
ncbi:MAG: hypothetical protein ACLQGP_40085, partial [Isosphaeraceae bacterium]